MSERARARGQMPTEEPETAPVSSPRCAADACAQPERAVIPSSRRRWRVGPRVLFWSIVAVTVVEQIRLSWFIGRTVTNDDATLLWYAAQEWGAHQVRQPGFYGQSYGSTLEGIPLDALGRMGVDPWVGLPIVMGVLAVGGWLLLAVAAWQRSHRTLAGAAVAAPVLLSAYHGFFVTTVPAWTAPRFLAVAGVAVLIMPRLPKAGEALAVTLLGLGVVMDPSNSLLAVPVVLWFVLSRPPARDRVVWLVVGGVIPAAWFVWSWLFFRAHPDYNLHGAASLRPSWDLLAHNLTHLGGVFDLYAPELGPFWLIPVGVFLALVAVLVATRRVAYGIPAVGALALLLWGMATPKADPLASLGRFLPPGRLFLALPYLVWFFAVLVTESGTLSRVRVPARAALIVVALVVVSVGVRFASAGDFDVRDDAVAYGRHGFYSFGQVENLRSTCDDVRRVAKQARASIAVFLRDPAQPFQERTLAYGCGALAYGSLDTLEPNYERRTWRLYDERDRSRTAAVIWGVTSNYCDYAQWRVERCKQLGPEVVGLSFNRQSILALLASLEITVRPFGPRCEPKLDLVAVGCTHPLQLPVRDLVTGPPPADPALARSQVEDAFSHMFETDADGRLINVEGLPPLSAGLRRRLGLTAASAPDIRVKTVRFLDPRQALVEFLVAGDGAASRTFTLTGRAIEIGNSWLATNDTFCRSTFTSGLGQC